MLTSKEKRAFLESIVALPTEPSDMAGVQKRIYEQLLLDTIDGKLYKYRSFDSYGYSLKNLEDGTLHCAAPSSFNDPFDCKIGITLESLYKAKYGIEIDLISRIFEKFLLVAQSKTDIDGCDENERRVILKLMQNKRLMQFVNQDYSQLSTEEDVERFFKTNAVVALELLQMVLLDQSLSPSLGTCASILPMLIANISQDGMLQLAKENSTLRDFANANGITEDTDEIGLSMLLINRIHPEFANAAEDVQKTLELWEQKVSARTAELFWIGCLCTNYKNRLMWSHYSDGHKGFCVEYDYSELNEEELNVLPLPVVYSKKRPLIPWEAAIENTPQNLEVACRQMMMGLLTKDSEWSYENEWRIFTDTTSSAEVKMPRISCVYLGASITEENRNKILKIARKKNIPVKQMKVDRGEYDLHAITIVD